MDRYEELMLGLYQGFVPAWLPEPSRELFERESLRRRCTLGQSLVTNFRCTMYCARALFGEDFTQEVCTAWPQTRSSANDVATGLYFALDDVLRGLQGAEAVRALAHYEALAVTEISGALRVPRVDPAEVLAADVGTAQVYRFEYAVPEVHARMTLYAGGSAPAAFVRDYQVAQRPTFIGRTRAPRGWAIVDVTPNFLEPHDENDHGTTVVH